MSRYYEEGYIEVDYFEEVIAVTGTYYEDGYIESGYFEGDAIGSVQEAYAALAAEFALTENSQKISDFIIATGPNVFIFESTVTRIVQSGATLIDAFIPTVTASGFKNSTAIIDSVFTVQTEAYKISDAGSVFLAPVFEFATVASGTYKISDVNVNTLLISSVTADVDVIVAATDAQSLLFALFTMPNADANVIKQTEVTAISTIGVNADANVIKDNNSSLEVISTNATVNDRIRSDGSDITLTTLSQATVNKTVDVDSSAQIITDATAIAGRIIQGDIEALTLFNTGFTVETTKNSFAILDNVVSMSATANLTRDNDVTLSNIIALSLQAARNRDNSIALLTSFEGVTNEARFRDTNSSLAFSFVVGNNDDVNNGIGTNTGDSLIRQTTALLSANSTLSVDAGIVKQTSLNVSSITTASADAKRYRGVEADFIAFYTTANPITDGSIDLGGNSGGGSLVVTPVSANLSSTFTLYALEDIRPLQVRITDVNGGPTYAGDPISIFSSTDRFKIGSASIRTGTNSQALSAFLTDDIFDVSEGDFTLEYWIDHNGFDAQFASVYIEGSVFGISFEREQSRIRISNAGYIYYNVELTDVVGEFNHVAFVRRNGYLSVYVDGVASTSGSQPFNIDIVNANRFMIFPHTLVHYYDEIRLSTVARYTSNFQTRLTPFSNDSDTVLLIHGDGNVKDSIEVLNTAELFASTAMSADITETKFAELGTGATATLNATANIIKDTGAVASTQASLQASTGKVLQFNADTTSTATASATAGIILQFNADCGSLFTPSCVANASINYTAILDAVTTVDAEVIKITDTEVDLNTAASVGVDNNYIKGVEASLEVASTAIAINDKIVSAESNLESAATASIIFTVVATKQANLDAFSEFTVNITTGNILEAEAILSSAFTPTLIYKVVVIDAIVYVIPNESRTFVLNREARSYSIIDESRTYTI